MQPFPPNESTLILQGPAGDLELLALPTEKPSNTTAIICHPHPLFGGTMKNKVVTTLSRVCHDLGARTVRFNFRGVGKSAGIHDEGRGEVDDVLVIADWIKTNFPNDKIWLAGFSFGAYVATKAAMKLSPAKLITIAPQASRFKQDDLIQVTCPWILVQGEEDEVVSAEDVFAWVETLQPKPQVIRMPGAGHFFHGQLLELRSRLESALLKDN
ncbi:MAG: alpha/beta fold hydrolase [Gammaproteobacteria bacterium]